MESEQEKARGFMGRNGFLSSGSDCWQLTLDKERLREILDNIPSAVILIEKPDGMVVYANKPAIELYGLNPCGISFNTNLKGLKIRTLEGKTCPTKQLYTYRALYNGETAINQSEIIERKDGKRYIMNTSVKPLFNKKGQVEAAIAIFIDVTERFKILEEIREGEERLKMAQQVANMGSWEYYVKENRAIWSEELFRIFGLPLSKRGPTVEEYIARVHPEDRSKVKQGLLSRGITLGAKASFDYRIIRDDGSIHTIHSERQVREVGLDKKPVRIIGIEQDITDRKQIEQKLEEYAKNLEKLVEERTRQLKNAERLAAIGQTAGMIGHDIRNPLQAIAGELFLMKQDVDSSPDSACKRQVQESLAAMEQQVEYINKIVLDLQDYARPLNPERVDVNLCFAIPQMLSTVNIPSNITASEECQANLPTLKLDLTFLKRILVNLVTNSIQAMPYGGKLTVSVYEENNAVNITVADTGVGIPEEVKPRVFQPLMTTKSKGQGFGLAATKRLVEALGGTISFDSKVGEGTKFKIAFPKETSKS